MLATRPRFRNKWIAVIGARATILQQLNQLKAGTFTHIVNVGLVCQPKHKNFAALHGLAVIVQQLGRAVDCIVRHAGINFTSQLNELGAATKFLGLPCEIERINWNAMSAKTWPWKERHETKRLGARGANHFPHINAHWRERGLEFIHQRNVDGAENILKQLCALGNFRAGHFNHFLDALAIHRGRKFSGLLTNAADQLWNSACGMALASRIFTLWTEGRENILAQNPILGARAGGLEHRGHHVLARGAWIRCAFKNNQLSLAQCFANRIRGLQDVRNVRLLMAAKRSWHAHQNHIALAQAREIRRGFKSFAVAQRSNHVTA